MATVTDAATIAQLTAINANAGLSYTSVADTAANLVTNTGGYLFAGIAATVSDAATIAQLTAINATAPGVFYTMVIDTAANMATDAASNGGTGTFLTLAVAPMATITDAATIAQLTAINANVALSYTSVADTAANLVTNALGYVFPGIDVTVTDTATVAQMNTIDAANGTGLLNGTVSDTSAALATALTTGNVDLATVQHATQVDVGGTAVAATLALDTSQFGNFMAGTSLLNASDTIAINDATIANLGTLHTFGGNGTLTLGGAGNGAYTVNMGTSGETTIHLAGTGNHVITAGTNAETFVQDATQGAGGSTINGLLGGDHINIDATVAALTTAQGTAALVTAAGQYNYSFGTLTYYNNVNNVAETLHVGLGAGATTLTLQTGGHSFLVG